MKKKATTEERRLHSAVLTGDDLALSKLYTLYGESIIERLIILYRTVAKKDEDLIFEAVNEAFWGYYNNPTNFDPEQSTLKRFLEVAAERDLKNILAKEKKHFGKRELPEDVELQEKFWNSIVGTTETTDTNIIQEEVMKATDKELANHFKTSLDITLAKLVLQKERETDVFIKALGIEGLSLEEQRVEVKRHKDRIKKVLERNQVEQNLKKLIQ